MGNPTENELIARQLDTLRESEERTLHVAASWLLSHVHAQLVGANDAGYLGAYEELQKHPPNGATLDLPPNIVSTYWRVSEIGEFLRRFVVGECLYGLPSSRLHVLARQAVTLLVESWPTAPEELTTAMDEERYYQLEAVEEYSVAGSTNLGATDHMSRLQTLSRAAQAQGLEETARLASEFVGEVGSTLERWLKALAGVPSGALTDYPYLYVRGAELLERWFDGTDVEYPKPPTDDEHD